MKLKVKRLTETAILPEKAFPTVIEVSGRRYVHDNADTYKPKKIKPESEG